MNNSPITPHSLITVSYADVAPPQNILKNDKIRWTNIHVCNIQQFMASLIIAMTTGNMMDLFIFDINNQSSSAVGYVYTSSGFLLLILAFPLGNLIDKHKSKITCRIAAASAILSGILGVFTILTENTIFLFSYYLVTTISQQIGNTVATTLFTNSLTIKERLKYFPLRGSLAPIGQAVGPLIQIVYFFFVSNVWDLGVLKVLLLSSISILYPTIAILYLLMNDVDTSLIVDDINDDKRKEYHLHPDDHTHSNDKATTSQVKTITSTATADNYRRNQLEGIGRYSPYIALTSSFTKGFAAGIFIKYVPMFLVSEYEFSPIAISTVYFMNGVIISIGIHISKIVARYLGRPITSFIFASLGFIFCLSMGFSYTSVSSVGFFFARAIFQNSIRHLDSSFMMDYIPNAQRGKFNAILSFSNVYFGGSSFIGGLISDYYSYRLTFIVTSGVFLISLLIYSPIIFSLPQSDKPKLFRRLFPTNKRATK